MDIGYIKHRMRKEADAEFAKWVEYKNNPNADDAISHAILEGYVVMDEFLNEPYHRCSSFCERLFEVEHNLERDLIRYKSALRQDLHETDVMLKEKIIKWKAIAHLKSIVLTEDMTDEGGK